MRAKDAVGRRGEQWAAELLEERGWRILERNWRGHAGEVDIVALDGDELVLVEVKTRSGRGYGHPAEAVTALKLGRLRRLGAQWIAEHGARTGSVRVDVVAIVAEPGRAPVVEHLVGVS